MLRNLIAVVLSVSLAIMGLTSPAYADSNIIQVFADNQATDNHSALQPDPLVKSFGDSAKNTFVSVAGAAVVCYGIGGVATTIFPPAAGLMPYCPAAEALVGKTSLNSTIKVAKHIPVKKTIWVAKHLPVKQGLKIVNHAM